MEAVLWIARTGSPWRDLPSDYGKWNTAFKRFRDWMKADVFNRLFEAVSDEPDRQYAMVDAPIIKVHRHGQGAKGDSGSGHRQVQRRHDQQNPGIDRCFGQSGALCPTT
ncbi:transposase [Pseudomonas putida]|nr:transposase [Pseudomonas putida]